MLKDPNEERAERIRSAIKNSGLKQSDIAKQVGVSPQAVYGWMNTGKISNQTLAALAKLLNTDFQWLAGGGERKSNVVSAFKVRAVEDSDHDPNREIMVKMVDVELSAGAGAENLEFIETSYELAYQMNWFIKNDCNPEASYLFKVRGDSMEPFLFDRDVVLIDTSDTRVVDGSVYAIFAGGGDKIKRLRTRADGTLVIQSDNPEYEDELVEPGAFDAVRIIGRAKDRSGGGGLR